MAQLYQFLASDGEIQPLYTVRGVLDSEGTLLTRYDKAPAQPDDRDRTAARLVTLALQQAVSAGTGRQLVNDGLGKLKPAGKTGTSNDSRDSWFAGWTGAHLAVAWVGNDDNKSTGLYGATGGMRVWSDLFGRLPSAPLEVDNEGLEWSWITRSFSSEPSCPGARRFPFVKGYVPAFETCVQAAPPDPYGEDGYEDNGDGTRRRSWLEIFGFRREREREQQEQQAQQEQQSLDPARQVPPPPPPTPEQ